MDLPIVCTLTEAELRERRRTVLAALRASVTEIAATTDGYIWRFPATADILAKLTALVDMERQCCAFLTFKITVEPKQPIELKISSPPEAHALIADLFGTN